MVRAGRFSEEVALIDQHSALEGQKEIATGLDACVRADRQDAARERACGAAHLTPYRVSMGRWCSRA